jgi:hypothetical protein
MLFLADSLSPLAEVSESNLIFELCYCLIKNACVVDLHAAPALVHVLTPGTKNLGIGTLLAGTYCKDLTATLCQIQTTLK